MILGKSNLVAVAVAGPDKDIPVLDCLYIAEDGSTVAGSRKALVMVSPVPESSRDAVPLKETKCGPVAIIAETIKDVLKIIPSDKKYRGLLEHVDIEQTSNGVIFTSTDGKRQKQIAGKITDTRYTNYREIFKRAYTTQDGRRIVLNRKRLRSLLDTLDKIAPDSSGRSPVYIEFTKNNDVVIRCENIRTGQRVSSIMWSYQGLQGKWLDYNQWELDMIEDPKPKPGKSGKITKKKSNKIPKKRR